MKNIVIAFLVLLSNNVAAQNQYRPLVKSVAKSRGIVLRNDCVDYISQDINRLTNQAKSSDKPESEIEEIQVEFIHHVLNVYQREGWTISPNTYGGQDYLKLRPMFFYGIVEVVFNTIPSNAIVKIDKSLTVGKTKSSKKLDSDRAYFVTFELNGYQKRTKKFYVMNFPDTQYINIKLEKTK